MRSGLVAATLLLATFGFLAVMAWTAGLVGIDSAQVLLESDGGAFCEDERILRVDTEIAHGALDLGFIVVRQLHRLPAVTIV